LHSIYKDYQDEKWRPEKDTEHSLADWLIFIDRHLFNAKYDIYMYSYGHAKEEIRKIAALCVACMEYNDTAKR